MSPLLGIGVVFQLVACAVVGARLLLLARRTRQVPELALGSAFVLLGALGYPLAIAARTADEGGSVLLAGALIAQDAAALCMYVTTWKTFRPTQAWMGSAIAFAAACFAGTFAAVAGEGWGRALDEGAAYYVGFALRAGSFAWAAVESLRYHALLRRRLKVGLADAVVANRFGLWSMATLAVCAGFAVFLAGRLISENVATAPWVLAATSVSGIVGGTALWLAFFPPRPYTTWIQRRSAGVAPAESALRTPSR